ncbi:RraA family protein [Pandoraea anhela]|uniref:Methyltransferase n=1 Tax=Pandoraea anhela TaxID=2508295 RepID=A0A5E4WF12_9BURK|nr:hypothetical protein [Pandoraea anhela]VVE23218.1 methyltransferase [Pandoraea anhela]
MYDANDLAHLEHASTAAIADALDTMTRKPFVVLPPVKLQCGKRIFGPAVTVMMAPTGEKAPHNVAMKLLDECAPGTVLVLSGEPDPVAGVFCEPEIAAATARRLGGLLTDCAVRWSLGPTEHLVGVAGASLSPASAFGRLKTMAVSQASPCGGVQVHTGDLVVGDALGVVVVPARYVPDVAGKVQHAADRVKRIVADVAEGRSIRDAVNHHRSGA